MRRVPIMGPAAWRGSDLAASTAWRHRLSGDEVAELDRALAAAKATGRPLNALRATDLPLPTIAAKIAAWRREVAEGRGFVLVQGFPVERWGADDASIVFYGLGLHLGIPGAQNPEGDLLGHVRDTGADQAAQERDRFEHQVGATVRPGALELVRDPAVGGPGQAVVGKRGPRAVAALCGAQNYGDRERARPTGALRMPKLGTPQWTELVRIIRAP